VTDDDDGGGSWVVGATADMSADEVERWAADDTLRALEEFRETLDADDDLTDVQRAAIFAFLDLKTPELLRRARADARQAHARLRH
jgi:hypothetical protein